MDNVKSSVSKEGLSILLSGHIDSSNASEVEAAINQERSAHPEGSFILDAEKLEYISSAGLRVILRLSKSEPTLRLINVSTAVFEVLEMTGFSEMFPVEKAYRSLSVEGCEIIGQGSNGKVYRLDPDTIIKVYNKPDALPDIRRERELARKAFVKGIPTAIPFDVVKVGAGYGSVFELLSAKSFSKLLNEDPSRMDELVAQFVDLLKKIHATDVEPGDLPSFQTTAVDWALFLKDYLPAMEGEKLLRLMKAIPDVHKMIHGDYHTKNVMMQGNDVLLIDMDTLSYGHPVFEIAGMFLSFVGFGETDPDGAGEFLGISYPLSCEFFEKSMERYLGTTDPKAIQAIVDKARIIGYTRLARRTIRRLGLDNPKGKALAEHCLKELAMLLDQTETLAF
jgi:uncharacterized protein (TIGR02172 family)